MTDINRDHLDPEKRVSVERLTRDLADAAKTMTDDEARFLVDAYYISQENRKRTVNQEGAMAKEPHLILAWLSSQNETLEGQIKRALDKYTDVHPVGIWAKSIYGIGPVISAGVLAHIDITKCPTVGHIWRFAGLDPSVTWEKKQKRPWNADLKTLCWKIGQSFMKFSNEDGCFYGKIYRERKAYEVARNDRGDNAATAAQTLATKKIGPTTDNFKHLSAGKLSPAQIDARARRYAVKMFLSHLHCVWYWTVNHEMPPKPYAITQLHHAHAIDVPNRPEGMPSIQETISQTN